LLLFATGVKFEGKRISPMAKRKGKNQSVPAKNSKYADRNNTSKKTVTKKD
jgi:hypothetical protein